MFDSTNVDDSDEGSIEDLIVLIIGLHVTSLVYLDVSSCVLSLIFFSTFLKNIRLHIIYDYKFNLGSCTTRAMKNMKIWKIWTAINFDLNDKNRKQSLKPTHRRDMAEVIKYRCYEKRCQKECKAQVKPLCYIYFLHHSDIHCTWIRRLFINFHIRLNASNLISACSSGRTLTIGTPSQVSISKTAENNDERLHTYLKSRRLPWRVDKDQGFLNPPVYTWLKCKFPAEGEGKRLKYDVIGN